MAGGMKVLVACEESQVVCQAFRDKGHEAYSCDIKPTRGKHPEWHIQGDALSIITRGSVQNVLRENAGGSDWDLKIAHPPCTYLCNSGVRWLYNKDGTIHPEWHIQGDALSVIARDSVQNVLLENAGGSDWDLLIAHPPCTYLCNSGVRWLYNKDGTINKERYSKMKDAAIFFRRLWLCNVPHICIENPIMHGLGKYEAGVAQCYDTPKFKQIIQPWMFGHGETKATCLWLKNLPKLRPTNIVPGREPRVHHMSPGPNRSRDRAVTYTGIANAMADQWGCL